jgi:hypothetical protein
MNRRVVRWCTVLFVAAFVVGCNIGGDARAATRLPAKCDNLLADWLHQAGFAGQHHKVAWAVAMRESNGQPWESTLPDLGLFQISLPAWGGSKYWPADIYDPVQNAKAARRMVKAFNWRPWGLYVSGRRVSFDFSSYGGWSDWQRYNWIVEPYRRYEAQYPKKCMPVKVRGSR